MTLTQRLREATKTAPVCMPGDYLSAWFNNMDWLQNRPLRMLIAAYDMFLYALDDPSHPYAMMRTGTLVSREKHCAILRDVSHMAECLGRKPEETYLWGFTPTLADSFERMARLDQEIGFHQSYSPYMVDLFLSIRSPFSASINPACHLFANATSALMGSSAAQRTKYIKFDAHLEVITNALVVAYVHRQKGKSAAEASHKTLQARESTQEPEGEAEMGPTSEPSGHDPLDWFTYMSLRQWNPSQAMLDWGRAQAQAFRNVSRGSVGEHVRNNL